MACVGQAWRHALQLPQWPLAGGDDLYLGGTEVIVEGTINGDLMAGGEIVIIKDDKGSGRTPEISIKQQPSSRVSFLGDGDLLTRLELRRAVRSFTQLGMVWIVSGDQGHRFYWTGIHTFSTTVA